jgi:hypothetical protein
MGDGLPARRRVPLRRWTTITRHPKPRAPVIVMPLVAASDAQRAKVSDAACIVCERSPVDPAHLVPRRLGGCDHPDCVVPLCRSHHRQYDHAQLNLLPYLLGTCERELRHAEEHVPRGVLMSGLSGGGWAEPIAGGG